MIKDALKFMARSSIQVMLGKDTDNVTIQFTADTMNNAFNLKIENTPFAEKHKNIGQILTKQSTQHLMDAPMTFRAIASMKPTSNEFKEIWKNNEKISIKITSEDAYAEQFLKAFSKTEPEIDITAREIPNFDNPKI